MCSRKKWVNDCVHQIGRKGVVSEKVRKCDVEELLDGVDATRECSPICLSYEPKEPVGDCAARPSCQTQI